MSEQDPLIGATGGKNVVSLGDIFKAFRTRWPIIVLTTVLAVGIAVGYSLYQMPQYEASTSILIGQERGGMTEDPLGVQGLRDLTKSMNYAVHTNPVAEEVVRRLNLNISPEELLGGYSSGQVPDTQFLSVRYRDSDPGRAQLVVNTIGDVFSEQIYRFSSTDNSASSTANLANPTPSHVTATVWERASVPVQPVSPNTGRNAILGLLAGMMVGVGVVLLLYYFHDRWHSVEEVEQVTDVPTFGVIPPFLERPRG